jgi:hypothetical protein
MNFSLRNMRNVGPDTSSLYKSYNMPCGLQDQITGSCLNPAARQLITGVSKFKNERVESEKCESSY